MHQNLSPFITFQLEGIELMCDNQDYNAREELKTYFLFERMNTKSWKNSGNIFFSTWRVNPDVLPAF